MLFKEQLQPSVCVHSSCKNVLGHSCNEGQVVTLPANKARRAKQLNFLMHKMGALGYTYVAHKHAKFMQDDDAPNATYACTHTEHSHTNHKHTHLFKGSLPAPDIAWWHIITPVLFKLLLLFGASLPITPLIVMSLVVISVVVMSLIVRLLVVT